MPRLILGKNDGKEKQCIVLPKEMTERIAQLEQLVGRLTVAVDIHKRSLALLSGKADPNSQDGKGSPE